MNIMDKELQVQIETILTSYYQYKEPITRQQLHTRLRELNVTVDLRQMDTGNEMIVTYNNEYYTVTI